MIEEIEIWKDVVGFEGMYEVSNFGNIKSCERITIRVFKNHQSRLPVKEKILSPIFNKKNGYLRVSLSAKLYQVHTIVAEAFLPNPEDKPTVNHIDLNKKNNSLSNLEWATRSEQTKHAYKMGAMCQKLGKNNNAVKVKDIEGNIYDSIREAWNENKEKLNLHPRFKTFWLHYSLGKTPFKAA